MAKQQVISLDIGADNIKAVIGKMDKKLVEVLDAFILKTPEESFLDGKVLDSYKIKSAVSHILHSNKVKVKDAVVTIQSTSIITRELVLPVIKEEEMQSMIAFEIEQYFPVNLEDYVVEHKILYEYEEDHIKKAKVLVAALPKTMAEDLLQLLQDLKLKPMALDIHSNAIAKLFETDVIINKEISGLHKTISVIDIGSEHINLNIISNGIPQFSRLIPLGGRHMDMNIANSLNCSLEEAEKKKREHKLDLNNAVDYHTGVTIDNLMKGNIDSWQQEIQRIFQYYSTRELGNRIDEVYLHGGCADIQGIEKYMESILFIPTFKIENVSNIKIHHEKVKAALNRYLNAIGAIIRK